MNSIKEKIHLIKEYSKNNYKKCFRQAQGELKYPYLVPGAVYDELWDWDSWLSGMAISEIANDKSVLEYEKGCVLNFLDKQDKAGRIPINVGPTDINGLFCLSDKRTNVHKPCLAQHALYICEKYNDYSWVKKEVFSLEKLIKWYDQNCYDKNTGLYYFIDDFAIGVDNDPCVFYRPKNSTASIYLNCLAYMELVALSKLFNALDYNEKADTYSKKAQQLSIAINKECYDEKDGFYYSADINLLPVDKNNWLHSGAPRDYNSLIMKIGVWSGFMPLWCGIASKEQAERLVKENYLNAKTFNAPYGVRSLSKLEKMYQIKATGNPSCWLGPIWINVNYFVFKGLINYGYHDLAKDLAIKTINLLGNDLIKCGEYHEYYNPETGDGVNNQGFQSWNMLAYHIAMWLEKNM